MRRGAGKKEEAEKDGAGMGAAAKETGVGADTGAAADLEVRVRRMTVGDIGQVLQIEKESFTLPWTAAAFFNELTNNPFARYLVLEQGGRIVAYGGMWTILDEAHVTNIAVRADSRGKRLGARILRELMVLAAASGMNRMTLEVRVSNAAARRLYESFGFREAGVRKGYYSDNGEDALIMWADLPDAPRSSKRQANEPAKPDGTGQQGGETG